MSPLQVWDSVWVALLASAILYGTYRAIEWRWPERYMGMTQTFGLSSQETFIRFLAYRAAPTYLFTATCFVTVERIGGNIWIAAGVMWLCSVLLTHGRIILTGFVRRWGEANYAGYHFAMIIMLSMLLLISIWTVPGWAMLVPDPRELLSALWSGLLVAGIGGFAVFVLRPRSGESSEYDTRYFVDRATRDVGIEALDWLFKECMRTGADPVLLKAVLVAESIQRPKWLRAIERVGVRAGLATTSGVMQMASKTPLSDRESITRAAEEYAGVWPAQFDGYATWAVDLGDAWSTLTAHNGDARFAESVAEIANYLLETVDGMWVGRSEDSPILLEVRRPVHHFLARGVTNATELVILEMNGRANFATLSAPEGNPPGKWWAWEWEFPSSTRTLAVSDQDAGAGTVARFRNGEVREVESVASGDLTAIVSASTEA